MDILVTGGAGFVGSHLSERLISEGHSVTVLDDLSTGRESNLEKLLPNPNFKLVIGSILDLSVLLPRINFYVFKYKFYI